MWFIAGSNINHAINVGNMYLRNNKVPILNYALEKVNDSKLNIYSEFKNNIFPNIPYNFNLALKISSFNCLSEFEKTVNQCLKNKITILIDAENGKENFKYHKITTPLFLNNNDSPRIYKTYQMYRKDSLDQLHKDMQFCKENNVYFTPKLVRGAYWNSEYKNGYLFIDKKDTDNSYNQAISNISNYNHNCKAILATHNEKSINLGLHYNEKLNKNLFNFAHLKDMKENYYNQLIKISNKNIEVGVYIPYGPYHKMIPYLIRRLYENIDIIKNTNQ